MRGSRVKILAACALALPLFASVAWASPMGSASTPAAQLDTALQKLHAWLGHNSNGLRWRDYLRSDLAEQQLVLGEHADTAAIESILAQYNSGAAGLEHPQFRAVRDLLAAWNESLRAVAPDQLPGLARETKEVFVPVTTDQVVQARTQLANATKRLSTYLATGGATGRAWRDYLHLDKLEAQLEPNSTLSLETLGDIYYRFRANHLGLELPLFADVARSLRHYVDVAAFSALADQKAQYARQLDSLAENLERYQQQPSDETALNIAQRLGWFEGTGQARSLIRSVRRNFSHPNLYVHLGAPLVEAGIARRIDQVEPVSDYILGTSIRGQGHMVGAVDLKLVPDPRKASLEAVLTSRVFSDTIGSNGPVTLFNKGVTDIAACKRIFLRDTAFFTAPTEARARTNSVVECLATDKGPMLDCLISKMAWKRVDRSKAEADAIASQHAEQRVSDRLDREVGVAIDQANRDFNERFRLPLLRRNEYPELLRFNTAPEMLNMVVLQANRFQLAAPTPAPQLTESFDLGVRVHQSMINNFAAGLIAGTHLDDAGLRRLVIKLTGSLPPELKEDAEEEPWSITFSRPRPVVVEFFPEGVRITISGRSFTSGEREFRAMNVTATYKMELTPTGVHLKRQGELVILPPGFVEGQSRLGAQQLALQTILRRRFGRLFKEEIVSHGLELPGRWKRLGKLRPMELIADAQGWLRLGWKIQNPAPTGAVAQVETP